ncbi:hypothetical protein J4443_01120 [Candidatus Woesearchaeota archaeon]|nr:hypothetical protein [Candidatus Woesearchaeota archaeon]
MKKEILEKTAKEYFNAAEDEFKKSRFNSALVLYFKSLVALVDLYILQQTNQTPSSHNVRFRITEDKFPEVYNLLDKDFPFYQQSYMQIMTKELAEVIKDDVQIMAEKTKIKL